jgi:hypothetical protein
MAGIAASGASLVATSTSLWHSRSSSTGRAFATSKRASAPYRTDSTTWESRHAQRAAHLPTQTRSPTGEARLVLRQMQIIATNCYYSTYDPDSSDSSCRGAILEFDLRRKGQRGCRKALSITVGIGSFGKRRTAAITYSRDEKKQDKMRRMIAFFDYPKEHWTHLRPTNIVESPFASVRLRTTAAKRYKRVENASALMEAAARCREDVPAPECATPARGRCGRRELCRWIAVTPLTERVAA